MSAAGSWLRLLPRKGLDLHVGDSEPVAGVGRLEAT